VAAISPVSSRRMRLLDGLFSETGDIREDRLDIVRLEEKFWHVFVPDDDTFRQSLGETLNGILLRKVTERRRGPVTALASAQDRMTPGALPLDQNPSAFERRLLTRRERRQNREQQHSHDDREDEVPL
jgi:hypothetical protein